MFKYFYYIYLWKQNWKHKMGSLKINMFQCVVNVESDIHLRDIHKKMVNENENMSIKLFAPGSLGRIVEDPERYQIGSISMKLRINDKNVSVLLFNTHKMKISGGLQLYDGADGKSLSNVYVDAYLQANYMVPIVNMIYGDDTEFDCVQHRLNAILYRPSSIGKKKFIDFIENLKRVFKKEHIIMPDIMRMDGNKRGRICAVKVKHESGKGVFAVDHSGNVQFFAYLTVEDLQKHKSELMNTWL